MANQALQSGPYLPVPIASPLAADVATTAVLMWNPLQYTKFYGDEATPGRVYYVKAGGIITNATTGSLIVAPSITTTNAAGTTLGTSTTNTVPGTAMTNQPWFLESAWVVRTVGAPGGNNATMMGEGSFTGPTLTAASGASIQSTFGGTSAVFDQSVANAIAITKTLSVAGSFTTHWVFGFWVN